MSATRERRGGSVLVRRARVEDAAAIARVYVDAWVVAYRGLVPDACLAKLSLTEWTAHWRARLADEDATLVADLDDEVAGYCRYLPGEIASLYVRSAFRRRGLGRALPAAALDELNGPVTLWGFAANRPARALYEAFGFAAEGLERVDPGTGVPELRMRLLRR